MSVESVARDFASSMANVAKLTGMATADAMVSGGVLPQPMPIMATMNIMKGMAAAMPDLKVEVKDVMVKGNDATVNVVVSGTQTAALNLGLPGMPTVAPTGKKVSANDKFVLTVQGDKVSHMHVDSPADGGIPALLAQLGAKMPGM